MKAGGFADVIFAHVRGQGIMMERRSFCQLARENAFDAITHLGKMPQDAAGNRVNN